MRTTTRSWGTAWTWAWMATLSLGGCGLFGGAGAGSGDGRCGRSMDADKFTDDFFDVMCTESAACGDGTMAQMWCEPSSNGTTGGAQCEFDRDAACDCLAGEYTCNEELTSFEFVEAPQVCVEIFNCGILTTIDTD